MIISKNFDILFTAMRAMNHLHSGNPAKTRRLLRIMNSNLMIGKLGLCWPIHERGGGSVKHRSAQTRV